MSKEQFIADQEQIIEDFVMGDQEDQEEFDRAVGRLVTMGFDRTEAEVMLREACL